MEQPLPVWLSYTTFVDGQGALTTGIIQLPLTYSGPSIPLSWPWVAAGDSGGGLRVSLLGGTGFQTLGGQTSWIVAQTAAYDTANNQPIATAEYIPIIVTPTAAAQTSVEYSPTITFSVEAQPTPEYQLMPSFGMSVYANGQTSFVLATPTTQPDGIVFYTPIATYPAVSTMVNGQPAFIPSIVITDQQPYTTVPATFEYSAGGNPTVRPIGPTYTNTGSPNTTGNPNTIGISNTLPQTITAIASTTQNQATFSSSPTASESSAVNGMNSSSASLSPAQIAGITVGAMAFGIILLALIGLCFFSRRRQQLLAEIRSHRWEAIPEMQEARYFDDDDVVVVPRPGDTSLSGHNTVAAMSSTLASSGSGSGNSPQRFPPGARSVVSTRSTGHTLTESLPSRESALFYTLPVVNRIRAFSGAQTKMSAELASSPDTMAFPVVQEKDESEFGVIQIHRKTLVDTPNVNATSPPIDTPENLPLLHDFDEFGRKSSETGKSMNSLVSGLGLGSLVDRTIWRGERRAASMNDAQILTTGEVDDLPEDLVFDAEHTSEEDEKPLLDHPKPIISARLASMPIPRKASNLTENIEETQSLIASIDSNRTNSTGSAKRDRRAVSEGNW